MFLKVENKITRVEDDKEPSEVKNCSFINAMRSAAAVIDVNMETLQQNTGGIQEYWTSI